jgi:hypothetical protein
MRAWPRRFLLFIAISTLPISLAFILVSFTGGVTPIWCGAQKSVSIQALSNNLLQDGSVHGMLCSFQAWLIVWGTIATAGWWAFFGLSLAYLCMNASLFKDAHHSYFRRFEILQIILAWGLPFVSCIVCLAAGKLVYEPGSTYCFISAADNRAWQIAFWFVPIGIYILVGTVGFSVCLFSLYRIEFRIQLQRSSRRLAQILRFFTFLGLFLLFWAVIWAQTIVQQQEITTVVAELINYSVCLFEADPTSCRSLYINNSGQFAFRAVADAFLIVQGFALCVIFLFQVRLWRQAVSELSRVTGSVNSQRPAGGVDGAPTLSRSHPPIGSELGRSSI